jgi:hypothetical protein
MEKKINVAELLKDCPEGMELDCTMFDNAKFIGVENYDKPICIRIGNGDLYFHLTKFGTWNFDDNAKCLIYPKGKTTWEGFVPPCKFKDGDILYIKTDSHNHIEFIIIFKEIRNNHIHKHACFAYQNLSIKKCAVCHIADAEIMRLATEEEKQKLLNAIKANGYKWNSYTKTLEKLIEPKFKVGDVIQDIYTSKVRITEVNIEDERYGYVSMVAKGIGSITFSEQDNWEYELVPNKFDINTLIPFESQVLVRNVDGDLWKPAIYGFSPSKGGYYVVGGTYWNQCIPHKGNEYLRGKTDDCKEYYKTWK